MGVKRGSIVSTAKCKAITISAFVSPLEQVDGHHQRGAVLTWMAILGIFIAYASTVVIKQFELRQSPSQSVTLALTGDKSDSDAFPNVVGCWLVQYMTSPFKIQGG